MHNQHFAVLPSVRSKHASQVRAQPMVNSNALHAATSNWQMAFNDNVSRSANSVHQLHSFRSDMFTWSTC